VNSRRLRLWAALATLAAGAAVLIYQNRHSPTASANRQRVQLERTRQLWSAAQVASTGSSSSYAAITVPGGARWVELLASAGVPVPVASEARLDLTDFRLVVTADPAQAEVLAGQGKAVVLLDLGGVELKETSIGWKDLKLPAAGIPVHPLALTENEHPWLQTEGGKAVAAWRKAGTGVVVSLGFDLAAWLYRLRQGDPALVGQDTDGNGTVQPMDLLPVLAPELLERPFADEMLDDLLATLDQGLACPLPRTAGLPNGRATVVLTSDQDYADDSFLLYMAGALEKHRFSATFMLTHRSLGAPADLNVGPEKPAMVGSDTVTELLAAGFGLGIHPSLLSVDDMVPVTEALARHTATRPLVARNHWVRWPGYLEVPMVEARAGIGMDLNFLRVCHQPGPCAGFLGGTARPVRFVDPSGSALTLLQQPTTVDDTSLRTQTAEQAKLASTTLGDRIAQLLPRATVAQAPLVINAHPLFFPVASDWQKPLIAGDVQVISAEAWLDFIARRRLSRIASPSCTAPPFLDLQPGIAVRPPG
jgi:hypothetical protein